MVAAMSSLEKTLSQDSGCVKNILEKLINIAPGPKMTLVEVVTGFCCVQRKLQLLIKVSSKLIKDRIILSTYKLYLHKESIDKSITLYFTDSSKKVDRLGSWGIGQVADMSKLGNSLGIIPIHIKDPEEAKSECFRQCHDDILGCCNFIIGVNIHGTWICEKYTGLITKSTYRSADVDGRTSYWLKTCIPN